MHQWLRQISMKLPFAVLRKSALKFTKGSTRENSISYYFLLFWFNQNSISVLKTLLSILSKMIETQKHQQSFEALGLFQIDFGLMTLISEIFLSTEHKFGEKC